MFEQYKLNKYQEYIKFTKTKVTYREYYKKAISDLKKNGYKPLAQFVEEERQRKVGHSKKLICSKFNIKNLIEKSNYVMIKLT